MEICETEENATVAEPSAPAATKKKASAAAHTHDKGYSKWDKFDVEAELASVDEEEPVVSHHGERGGGYAHVLQGVRRARCRRVNCLQSWMSLRPWKNVHCRRCLCAVCSAPYTCCPCACAGGAE